MVVTARLVVLLLHHHSTRLRRQSVGICCCCLAPPPTSSIHSLSLQAFIDNMQHHPPPPPPPHRYPPVTPVAPQSRVHLMRRTHTLSDVSPSMTPRGSFDELSPSTSSRKSSLSPSMTGGDIELPALTVITIADENLLQVPVDPRTMFEKPPQRTDTAERIPMRARSQSWLIRTRHLIGKHHVRRCHLIFKDLFNLFSDTSTDHRTLSIRTLSHINDINISILSISLFQSCKGI